jgi:mRNA-degrading endonuclease toxin of MazEF toxin-antitoxin module
MDKNNIIDSITQITETFIEWINFKINIHLNEKRPPYFNEGQIWWCHAGQNVGDEENRKGVNFMRPVFVVTKYNKNLCLVAPTSTKIKDNKFYYKIEYGGESYSILTSQLRTMDTKRFKKKITELPPKDVKEIQKYIAESIFRPKN